jgi:hypothetical protein
MDMVITYQVTFEVCFSLKHLHGKMISVQNIFRENKQFFVVWLQL